jgi:periplasmic copper chaperone A
MKHSTSIYAVCMLMLSMATWAKDPVKEIDVTDVWVRATHTGQQTGVAYMKIISQKNAELVKVETPVAKRAEMHNMEMKESVMVMREVDAIALPASNEILLAPGGYHIMLMNLKQPLKAGDKVPLKLSFKLGNETIAMDVLANVRKN